MFDADTVALIRSAPALEGVDLDELPLRLTQAYASIVAARIRIRTFEGALPEDAKALIDEIQRLAFTHEALVSAMPDRENRVAAAFVAGAAHHVGLLAQKVVGDHPGSSYLGFQAISPEISATLLFLIAEATADAAELAKLIVPPPDNAVCAALCRALVCLARGELKQLIEAAVPSEQHILAARRTDQGLLALYFSILRATRALAATFLGQEVALEHGLADIDPGAEFQRIKELCLEPIVDSPYDDTIDVYPGPFHLASLLHSVAKDLPACAVVATPAPPGINSERWINILRDVARNRPYLWHNHRQAVTAGYLEPGVSSVISFPTGAGKSTLAELKIAAALLRNLKVIFLAPTLALVDQTAKGLALTFPNAQIQKERAEELIFDFEDEVLPAISVMTPERCLALIGFDYDAFEDVGLLVFDECHLLHPRDIERSRRSIDAMLCLLNFTAVRPDADLLLLSAMMGNTDEIAAWLEDLTGRRCIALGLTWKPTRQVRGCVVYNTAAITELKNDMAAVRAAVANINAPAELRRRLRVQPFGFFCLRQTWQSNDREDYALLPILNEPIQLATGTTDDHRWYLTPNANQVSAAIAASTATSKLKTLIFAQTIPLTNSTVKVLTDLLDAPGTVMTPDEVYLYTFAVEEAGGPSYLYLEVQADGRIVSPSVCHHGLLLAAERHLHESLFRRSDGLNVMVATSTLAQGMNLPSEVVIIAGDSRFDPAAEKMEQLEAHELLNAAGRAGRAGENSYGFVLVIPSKVMDFDDDAGQIHNYWMDLQAIFAQSDHCLTIEDPMVSIMDQIQIAGQATSDLSRYMIRRLPVGSEADEGGSDQAARALLKKSFGAYQARMRGDQAWVDSRIEAALNARRADPEAPEALTWADRLAASAGVSASVIRSLDEALTTGALTDQATVAECCLWVATWLGNRPQLIPALIRTENLEGLFGAEYKALEADDIRGRYALPKLVRLLQLWMAGAPLVDIERAFGTPENRLKHCESARQFAIRLVPELAYIFGLPAQVLRAKGDGLEELPNLPIALAMLGPCVREGLDTVEKIALRQHSKGRLSRVGIHREYLAIEEHVAFAAGPESFDDVMSRIGAAIAAKSA